MNQECILKMAREADPDFDSDPEDMPFCLLGMDAIERFAALVAAKAAQDEREACEKACMSRIEKIPVTPGSSDFDCEALACAIAIKKRGQ